MPPSPDRRALEKGANVVAINPRRGFSLVVKKSREFPEVAPITLNGIERQAFFYPSKIKKELHFRDEWGV